MFFKCQRVSVSSSSCTIEKSDTDAGFAAAAGLLVARFLWILKLASSHDCFAWVGFRMARISTSEFDALDQRIQYIVSNKQELKRLWAVCDFNGNGMCSLAEIDKMVLDQFPALRHPRALIRAYKKATIGDPSRSYKGKGDSFIQRQEFICLLKNIVYFNRVFSVFEAIDTGDDHRIDIGEFKRGLPMLGLQLSAHDAEETFRQIDRDGGGQILFEEFCSWLERTHAPVD
jgi:Ca2+-binding EF-hand superfamily protein